MVSKVIFAGFRGVYRPNRHLLYPFLSIHSVLIYSVMTVQFTYRVTQTWLL